MFQYLTSVEMAEFLYHSN